MPKSPLTRLLSLRGFARRATVLRRLHAAGVACLCICIDVGAAHAASNPPDGDWYVAVSCEENSRARAFSFREKVRISGGEFALTVVSERFTHELSGSIKDDRVRLTGLGLISATSPSTDRTWRFSGRLNGSPEVRVKGTMNGRDTGNMFYQDCELFMSPVATVATSTPSGLANGAPPVGEAVAKEGQVSAQPSAKSIDPQQRAPSENPIRSASSPEPEASAAGSAINASQPTAESGSAGGARSSSPPAIARAAPATAAARAGPAETAGRSDAPARQPSAVATSVSSNKMQRIRCDVPLEYEYFPDAIPEMTKTCADFGTPLETCTAFSFYAKGHPKEYAYTDATSPIGRTAGVLDFKPVGLDSFDEMERGALSKRWVLNLIDNSGSPTRAEERFVVLDGAFKPMTKVLKYVEKETYLKQRKMSVSGLLNEPLNCKVQGSVAVAGPAARSPAAKTEPSKTQAQGATPRPPAQPPASLFKPGDFWTGKQ